MGTTTAPLPSLRGSTVTTNAALSHTGRLSNLVSLMYIRFSFSGIIALTGASSFLVSPRRGIDAPRAGGGRAAPDALVAAVSMAMELVRRIDATVPVAGRSAPLAVLLVIDVLMNLLGTVDTAVPVTRRSAMPAFRAHTFLLRIFYHISAQNFSLSDLRGRTSCPCVIQKGAMT